MKNLRHQIRYTVCYVYDALPWRTSHMIYRHFNVNRVGWPGWSSLAIMGPISPSH